MLKIQMLGPLRVEIDGVPLPSPKRSKAIELLVLLAFKGGLISRDFIAEALWEKEPLEQSRAWLRQTLSALKKALGESHQDILITEGNKLLVLDLKRVSVDLRDFERHEQQQQWAQALDLIRGPFLEGSNFGDWFLKEQNQLQLRVDNCQRRLSEETPPLVLGPLPEQLTQLQGREEEARRLLDDLKKHRLVTITGLWGIGKSHLCIELARRYQEELGIPVAYVNLSEIENLDYLGVTIATALGQGKAAPKDWQLYLEELLQKQKLLLVLDDCTHLIDPVVRLVRGLFLRAPKLRVLVTSQEPLKFPSERVFPLTPLSSDDALSFLLARIADMGGSAADLGGADFSAESSRVVLQAICGELEGVPLALQLAASAIVDLGAATVARDLKRALLNASQRAGTERQNTLRASLLCSLAYRTDVERRFFGALTVFRGGFDPDSAAAVAGISPEESESLLIRLTRASLIERVAPVRSDVSDSPRWRMREIVRMVGWENLSPEERQGFEFSHLSYFHARVCSMEQALARVSEEESEVLQLLPELDNLRTIVAYGLRTTSVIPQVLDLLRAGRGFWELNGLFEEYYTSVGRLLAAASTQSIPLDLRLQLLVLNDAGSLAFLQDQFTHSEEFYQRALSLAQANLNLDDSLDVEASYGLSMIALIRGQYREAARRQQRVLEVYEGQGKSEQIARTWNGLALTSIRLGEYAQAQDYLTWARDYHEAQEQFTIEIVNVLHNQAELKLLMGDWEAASRILEQLWGLKQRLLPGDRDLEGNILNLEGLMLYLSGALPEARSNYDAALKIFRARDQKRGCAHSLLGLGRVCIPLEQWQLADLSLQEAFQCYSALSDARHEATSLERLAVLRAQQMQPHQAAKYLEMAGQIRERSESPIPPIDRAEVELLRLQLAGDV